MKGNMHMKGNKGNQERELSNMNMYCKQIDRELDRQIESEKAIERQRERERDM